MEWAFVRLILAVFYVSTVTGVEPRKLNPVILIPGDGGSQLEAKLNKPSKVAWYCKKKTDYWFDLWLNIESLLPKAIDCLVDNMRLVYDNKTRTTSNSPGVDIRVPGFGETETVEWFDPSEHWFNEQKEYFQKLQELIENTYSLNFNTSVVLLGHSMGNTMALYFLNHMTNVWKSKYIRSFISLAGPWGGAVKSVKLMISGDNLKVPIINPVNVRRQQRSMPSTAWLMPSEDFWKPDETLVVSPSRNYTVKDLKTLFHDINYTTGYMMWEDTRKLTNPLKAPGVEIHCLYGIGVKTPITLVYNNKNWHEGFPNSVYSDGDGTVNIRSLHGYLKFEKQQKQPVHHKEFENAKHMEILKNDGAIEEIQRILADNQHSNET